jgi:hypothetical protein
LISSAQKVEHYEIAAYGTAAALAGQLRDRRRSAPAKISGRRTGSDLGISSVSDTCPTPLCRTMHLQA